MKTVSVSTKEINEVKEKLESGVIFQNDAAGYQILMNKGERVFFVNGKYRFFKNYDAFVRATVRIIKRGW